MKRPFIFILIPLVLGIITYYFVEINIYVILVFLLLFGLIAIINMRSNRFKAIPLWIIFFLLGILLLSFSERTSQLIYYIDMPIEVIGSVEDLGIISENEGRYLLKVKGVNSEEKYEKINEKITLKVFGEKQLELGDLVRFNAVLKEPQANTNPKLYNHKLNLRTKNIYTIATIKDYSIRNIDRGEWSFSQKLKSTFKENVENTFDDHLKADNSKLMKAIILGDKLYLDESSIGGFRELGLAHILAVSGLHIGILTTVLVGLFGFSGVNRRINVGLTLAIIWIYAYIIGNPSSVVRANIMFSLLLISQTRGEAYDSLNTLGFAMFLMLVVRPYSIFSIGFQLSFLATFSIIYFTPKINQWFYSFKSFWTGTLASLLAIQIGLIPIQAYYFNRIPLLTIGANLLLLPIFTISLVLAMILIPISILSIHIANAIGVIVDFLLNIQYYLMELLASFSYTALKIASPSGIEIILYYLLIFVVFNIIVIKKLDKKVVKTFIIYLLILIIANSTLYYLDESLEVQFIDVGQGDCILIRSKEGNYLIDTGGETFGDFSIGENITRPYLEKSGVFKLKGVFISHYHGDHCKALPHLMDNMIVENIFLGYKKANDKLYEDIVKKAFEKQIPIQMVEKGDRLKLDNNTNLLVLGPEKDILDGSRNNENDLSMVLLLNYWNKNILFTGDMEKAAEESLLKNVDYNNFNIDFLKVPHHGSVTSSTDEFLDQMNPQLGFASVGRSNSFGHPSEAIVDKYKARGIELHRTDCEGLIRLHLNRGKYTISPFIKRRKSISYVVEKNILEICYLIFYIGTSYGMSRYFLRLEKEMEQIEL